MTAAKLTSRLVLATLLTAATLLAGATTRVAPALALARRPAQPSAPDYVPGEVVVGYASDPGAPAEVAHATRAIGARTVADAGTAVSDDADMQVVKVPAGHTIWQAIAQLRRRRGVLYAVPNYIAHQAGGWIPNDPGNTHHRKGWQAMQWNFLAGAGGDAPDAWAHMFADHRPGGRGVVIAVLDTGVAYRNWENFRESPDFKGTHFVDPYDFVANNPYPLDREGHGTFVAESPLPFASSTRPRSRRGSVTRSNPTPR